MRSLCYYSYHYNYIHKNNDHGEYCKDGDYKAKVRFKR